MIRWPYWKERKDLLNKAIELRKQGYWYRTISNIIWLNIPRRTIGNWVKDIKVDSRSAYLKSIEERRFSIENLESVSKWTRRSILIKHYWDKCMDCNLTDWLENKLTIEVHHIDWNNKNNKLENLKLLCPNCHSITDNYRNKKRSE